MRTAHSQPVKTRRGKDYPSSAASDAAFTIAGMLHEYLMSETPRGKLMTSLATTTGFVQGDRSVSCTSASSSAAPLQSSIHVRRGASWWGTTGTHSAGMYVDTGTEERKQHRSTAPMARVDSYHETQLYRNPRSRTVNCAGPVD